MDQHEDHRKRVQREYGTRVERGSSSTEPRSTLAESESCPSTGGGGGFDPAEQARRIGYTEAQLLCVPEGAIMGMGCGNPTALAKLHAGETVLDVGCGGGLDVFLAAQAIGENGKVIGVDPTPQMVKKAKENARAGKFDNVLFGCGEVEQLPVANDSIDVVISNCVLNHCPDKLAAFGEIRRILRAGGRMCIADLVTLGEFSQEALDDPLWGTWLATASGRHEYLDAIQRAGFWDICVLSQGLFGMAEADVHLAGKIESLCVTARK